MAKDTLELLERLAALVPPPRRPLLAYHGVLAPRDRPEASGS
jgi:Putative transposase